MNQFYKNMLTLAMGILVMLAIFSFWSGAPKETNELDYSEFIYKLEAGEISEVRIQQDLIEGRTRSDQTFRSRGPVEDELRTRLLREHDVKVKYEPPDDSSLWNTLLISWLPMILFIGLWFLLFRQLQAGGGKAMSFGKARARLLSEDQQRVTFQDVAGIEEAKAELEEIVSFLRDPKRFTRLGGRIPKGVLLVGAPGTGKTLLARAIAGEAGVPFFSISGSDFVEMFVGVGASRVRDLFAQGKKNAPCIVFIDEIDAVGRHRGAGLGGGHDEREQTLNQLLVEMDGFESNEGVIIIAATNRPDVLDPAMLRPGRFDRHVVVSLPDLRGREAILRVHARRILLAPEVDLVVIARGTPSFSGADLENLVNEAALLAARHEADAVTLHDLELAKDKVMMGTERRSLILTEEERRTIAVHEGGHALVAMLDENCDPVHKVSIIPRGMALGVTQTLPTEDRNIVLRRQLLAKITHAMGGRAAEEVVFGHFSTGAADDLKRATNIAREMVCSYGMSEKLGPMSLDDGGGEVFLGRDIGRIRGHSEAKAHEIDEEVLAILGDSYALAKDRIVEKRDALDRIAEALLERETLGLSDLKLLLEGRELPPLPQPEAALPAAQTGSEPEGGEEKTPLRERPIPDPEPIPG
ncbi:MAG: ATP-dependent zinc metalloprotease FtsH [Deltaproteobacteria bacterium]|nr:ATP-dependent zinc metalloprotease FtsH [Deltaproteobacteria bacterium]